MDRLADLNLVPHGGGADHAADHADHHSHTGGGATAIGVPAPPGADGPAGGAEDPLDACFRLVADIQHGTRQIHTKTSELRAASAEILRSFDPERGDPTAGLQPLMDAVVGISRCVKQKLDQLSAENEKLSATPELEAEHTATIRIQTSQHQHLSRSFLAAMKEYRAATADNERLLREQTVRRIKLKYTNDDGTTVSNEQAAQMAAQVLESGVDNALFQQSKDTLASILETRRDLMKIERTMRELQQIVNDLAVIVNDQTEIMDQIYTNVKSSVQHVETGRKELKQAKKYQKAGRCKLCCVVICVALIVAVIAAVTLGFSIPIPKSKK